MVSTGRLKALASAIALAASVAFPTLSAAQTEFRGGGTISDFRGCESAGWPAQAVLQVLARHRPAGLSGNHPDRTGLSLFLPNGTIWLGYSRFANQYRAVDDYLQIWAWGDAASNPVALRRLAGSTTNITNATWQVNLVADVRHFGDVLNCEARVSLFLYRRG